MATRIRRPRLGTLPRGPVIQQKQGGRTYLVVQESPSKRSIVETWEDGLDVTNRLLVRLRSTIEEMDDDLSRTNKQLASGIREIKAKIKANQRSLDKLLEPAR